MRNNSTAIEQNKDIVSLSSGAGLARTLGRRVLDAGLVVFLVAAIVMMSFLSPYFLSFNNFMNILLAITVTGIVAVGMTLVIIVGGVDLSVASTMALTSSIASVIVMRMGFPWWLGIIGAITLGAILGSFNAVVITKLNIAPIIVTLATTNIFRGAAYILTGGNTIFIQNQQLEWFGIGRIFGIPVPVIILAITVLLMAYLLRFTLFGRFVYAVGGNKIASRLAGLNVKKYIFVSFVSASGLAAIAGIILIGLTGTAMPSAATGYEFDIVTAVLLGGASLSGGEGSVWGTLMGVLIIGIINNGMALMSVPPFWQIMAKGMLLLGAISLDALRKRV